MKKFVKLSLAAAVATAGLTTTASAVSLEEAIKGVDVTGQVRYRMEERNGTTATTDSDDQDVNIDVTVTVPVNDMVNFITNINIDNDSQGDDQAGLEAGTELETYFFQYKNDAVTAHLGTQAIPGRMTDAVVGAGIVGLYNTGAGITLGAASMYDTELAAVNENDDTITLIDGAMLNSVMIMGSIDAISYSAQYADLDKVGDAFNIKADVNLGAVSIGAEYTEKDYDNEFVDAFIAPAVNTENLEFSTFKAYASTKIENLSLKGTYATTGDDGSGSIDEGVETPAEFLLWQLGSAGKADMDVFAIDASYPLTDKISLRAAYADGDYDNDGTATDITETLGQVTYKMSKNLTTYVRYSEYEVGNAKEVSRGRLEVAYKF